MNERPVFYREVESDDPLLGWDDDSPLQIRARNRYFVDIFERRGGKFWKSPDIETAADIILSPESVGYVPVTIPPNLELFKDLHVDAFAFVHVSTRSRYAQLGVEVPRDARVTIPASLKDEIYSEDSKDLTAFVPVRNLSSRTVEIPQKTRLLQLYIESAVQRQKQSLLELLENRDVEIGGERGTDWDYWTIDPFGNNTSGKVLEIDDLLIGLRLRLDPQKRMWLPPDPEGRPFKIPEGTEVDYRKAVNQELKPAPISEKPIFWIGETTSRLALDPGVNALIVATGQGDRRRDMRHINSLLIDGGSNWKIRTEIISPTALNFPTEIFLQFYT